MERYPLLEINLKNLKQNSEAMNKKMNGMGLRVCGVVKVSDGDLLVSRAYLDGGCDQIGSSRITHLRELKSKGMRAETMLLRIPMECEIEDVVRYADISLNSDAGILEKLNEEAKRQDKTHSVIIMLDCGDKREGAADLDELLMLCRKAEDLPNLKLLGIGTNWGCVSGVEPDANNLEFLAQGVKLVEDSIGRKLDIVSGGNSTLLVWIYSGGRLPKEINHIRIGGTIANPINFRINRGIVLEGSSEDTFRLDAQISEVKTRDTKLKNGGINWKGEAIHTVDRGMRKRAIIDLGSADIGDCKNLIPQDKKIEVIAASSDHIVLDITDCTKKYKTGDVVSFYLKYSALLFAFSTRHITRRYV